MICNKSDELLETELLGDFMSCKLDDCFFGVF